MIMSHQIQDAGIWLRFHFLYEATRTILMQFEILKKMNSLTEQIYLAFLHNKIISLSGQSYQFVSTQYVVHVKHEKDICASSFYHYRWVQYAHKEKKIMF